MLNAAQLLGGYRSILSRSDESTEADKSFLEYTVGSRGREVCGSHRAKWIPEYVCVDAGHTPFPYYCLYNLLVYRCGPHSSRSLKGLGNSRPTFATRSTVDRFRLYASNVINILVVNVNSLKARSRR